MLDTHPRALHLWAQHVAPLKTLQLGGTKGTGHFCTCLQIYKLTCHGCLLGLFWGECGASLLFCFLGC